MAVDGYLNFNTKINTKGFSNDITNIGNKLGGLKNSLLKIGSVVATAFSVKALVDFGKQAVELASDLDEVQNVVDTAFGSMSYKMEEFSKSAVEMYGISKLTAKRTGSTFMAMASGMGLASESASDMSIALTGLSADMASFYNEEQDVTATALKSVFTGETETLKKYGIVMNEVNLQEYAYSQGITKKISAMSQSEKVMLRYNYVMQQTSLAQGDFAKTSQGWANQIRIIKELWGEFATNIGKILKNTLLPIVQKVTDAMKKLVVWSENVYNTLAGVFGWEQITQSATQGITDEITDSTDAQDGLTNSVEETNDALKKTLANYDELKVIQQDTAKSSNNANDSLDSLVTGATAGSKNVDIKVTADTSDAETKLSKLQETLKTGWETGDLTQVGQTIRDKIVTALNGIDWNGIEKEVKTGSKMVSSFINGLFDKDKNGKYALGQSFGETLAGALNVAIGGLATFITETDWKDIGASITTFLQTAFNKIDWADFGRIIGGGITGVTEFVIGLFNGIDWENLPQNVWDALGSLFAGIEQGMGETAESSGDGLLFSFLPTDAEIINAIQVFFHNVKVAFYNGYMGFIAGIIQIGASNSDEIEAKLNELLYPTFTNNKSYDEQMTQFVTDQDIIGNFKERIQAIKDVKKSLATEWFNFDFMGVDGDGDGNGTTYGDKIDKWIADTQKNIEKSWDNFSLKITTFFSGVKDVIENAKKKIILWWSGGTDEDGVQHEGMAMKLTSFFSGVKDVIKNAKKKIIVWWSGGTDKNGEQKDGMKMKLTSFFSGVKDVIKNAKKKVVEWWSGGKDKDGEQKEGMKVKLSTFFSGVKQAIKDAKDNIDKWWDDKKLTLKTDLSDGIYSSIKKVIRDVIDLINRMIDKINKFMPENSKISPLEYPSWTQTSGRNKKQNMNGYAKGTVVPANYGEFLAILGDNKKETEVVSPLSTMKKALGEALKENGGGTHAPIILQVNSKTLYECVWDENQKRYRQTGKGLA